MENNYSDEIAANSKNRQKGAVTENTDNAESSEMPTGAPPEMNCDPESDTNCEIPEPPEGFDGQMPEGMQSGGPGGMREFTAQSISTNPDAILHPVAYLAIGGGSVIIGILISYICFSKFFHLKPGQTFASKGRFIWFVVVTLVLAVGLCALGFFIPKWCS